MKKVLLFIIVLLIGVSAIYPVMGSSAMDFEKVSVVINGSNSNFERDSFITNGRTMVPARSALSKLGASVDWNAEKGYIRIVKGNTSIELQMSKKTIKVNDVTKTMDVEPMLLQGTVMVPISFVASALNYAVNWDGNNRTVFVGEAQDLSRGDKRTDYVVVIDPGHGGSESGAVYGGVMEKDLNLDIAKKLDSLLKAAGVKTYMTRENDSYLSLYARSDFANKVNADLFISVHNNAGNKSTSGSMSLYYPVSKNTSSALTGKSFAKILQNKLTNSLGTKDLGTIERPYLAVLRTSKMPAVIAEIGYMSNSIELTKLKTDAYKLKAATAIKDAILEALKLKK